MCSNFGGLSVINIIKRKFLDVYKYLKKYLEGDWEDTDSKEDNKPKNKTRPTNLLRKSRSERGTVFYNQTYHYEPNKRESSMKKVSTELKGVSNLLSSDGSEETTTANVLLQDLLQGSEKSKGKAKDETTKSGSWESIYFMSTIQKEFKRIAKQIEDMVIDAYNDDKE